MFIAQILIFQFVLHTKCTRHKIILFFNIFFVQTYAYSLLFRLVFASFCEKIIFTLIGLWFIIGLISGKMEKMCWDFLPDFHFITIVVTHGWMGFGCIYLIQYPCKIINNCPRWRRKVTHGWMDWMILLKHKFFFEMIQQIVMSFSECFVVIMEIDQIFPLSY